MYQPNHPASCIPQWTADSSQLPTWGKSRAKRLATVRCRLSAVECS